MRTRKNEILINHNPHETRVALLESGRLMEFYIEGARDRGIKGNIYKGRVVRVLPGMEAAFVEIGLGRTAFLHSKDIYEAFEEYDTWMRAEEGEKVKMVSSTPISIQDLLREGQEIMVQVAKEPIGDKGARVTSHISLPGRYLVLMPTYDRIGVSRRIEAEKERRRLREIVSRLKPRGSGFIIRTACEGMMEEDIRGDLNFLIRLWDDIQRRRERASCPALLYQDLALTLRTIRDLFTPDIDRLAIDSREEYERACRFVEDFLPNLRPYVELYEGEEPLFDAYGVEVELAEALEKRVWLKSGGYIIIDEMEALTAIDVNTGKYVGKRSSEETALKTNLEAVKEIVYQLRLRNIGGIIVIDFIDMAKAANREKVYNALREALKADRARTNILKISELGVVEMTRQRVRESITRTLCEPCPYCGGNGNIMAKDTVIMAIYRELLRGLPKKRRRKVTVYVHQAIADLLYGGEGSIIEGLEEGFRKRIVVKVMPGFHQEQYEIS
ncbi:MAG: Rne/Rng family ribonuclease [Deltaproteobacteria bacterium]|nr:Rne/Rng family ribonuclease [Deltaproteobacteria bacterium]